MSKKQSNNSNYEIKFKSGKLKIDENIINFSLQQQLDQTATCTIEASYNLDKLEKIQTSDFPDQVEFNWQNKKMFSGNLTAIDIIDSHSLYLTYQDEIHNTKKTTVDSFTRETTLNIAIDKTLSESNLKPIFKGSFDEQIDSFYGKGDSVYQILKRLSNTYGFHFACREQSDKVYIIKLDKMVEQVEVDAQKNIRLHKSHQNSNEQLKKVTLTYFCSTKLESEEKELDSNALTEPLGELGKSNNVKVRNGWKCAQGKKEIKVKSNKNYSSSQDLIKNFQAKKIVQQETISFDGYDFLTMPGDWIKLKNSSSPQVLDGTYLVLSVVILIDSSFPRMTIKAVRA